MARNGWRSTAGPRTRCCTPIPPSATWFERSWIPDETYLQTLLHITPGLKVVDRATTFVLDTPERPTPGWMQLSLDDLAAAWASGAPFFRKVDRSGRPEVVEAIDGAVDWGRSPARPGTAAALRPAPVCTPGCT